MNIKINKRIFNDTYWPHLKSYDNRFEVYYGGAGSGKSHFIAQKLLIKALQEKRKILILRKVDSTTRQSTWALMIETLQFFKLYNECKINLSTQQIALPNGSLLIFSGLQDPEKIKSIASITDIWMEEATEFTLEDFSQLNLRVRHRTARNQQIILSFNPVSKSNWVYKLFFESEYSNTKIVKTTYTDNRFLPQSYIDSLIELEKTNPDYYRIYALGEWGSLSRPVYSNWCIGFDQPEGEFAVGLDWGFTTDPTAIIAVRIDKLNKAIYVLDEVYKTDLLNSDIFNILQSKGYSKSLIVADSAEPKSIEDIKRMGAHRIKPALKGQGSVNTGIRLLQEFKIYISPTCTNTIQELQDYSWKKDRSTGEYIDEPEDRNNHLLDALRYVVRDVCQVAQFRTESKQTFRL